MKTDTLVFTYKTIGVGLFLCGLYIVGGELAMGISMLVFGAFFYAVDGRSEP